MGQCQPSSPMMVAPHDAVERGDYPQQQQQQEGKPLTSTDVKQQQQEYNEQTKTIQEDDNYYLNDYKIVRPLDVGNPDSISQIYMVVAKNHEHDDGAAEETTPEDDDVVYVLQVIDMKTVARHRRKIVRNEILSLRDIQHPYILRVCDIYDCTKKDYTLAMVTELCTGGVLHSNQPYPESRARIIVEQILQAVQYLHEKGIVRHSLTTENIMFQDDSPNADIKITFAGLAPTLLEDDPTNMAIPEISNHSMVVSGIYSIGTITYRLLAGGRDPPASVDDFCGEDVDQNTQSARGTDFFVSGFWKNHRVSPEAEDFVSRCLTGERFTVYEAQQHPWITQKKNKKSSSRSVNVSRSTKSSMLRSSGLPSQPFSAKQNKPTSKDRTARVSATLVNDHMPASNRVSMSAERYSTSARNESPSAATIAAGASRPVMFCNSRVPTKNKLPSRSTASALAIEDVPEKSQVSLSAERYNLEVKALMMKAEVEGESSSESLVVAKVPAFADKDESPSESLIDEDVSGGSTFDGNDAKDAPNRDPRSSLRESTCALMREAATKADAADGGQKSSNGESPSDIPKEGLVAETEIVADVADAKNLCKHAELVDNDVSLAVVEVAEDQLRRGHVQGESILRGLQLDETSIVFVGDVRDHVSVATTEQNGSVQDSKKPPNRVKHLQDIRHFQTQDSVEEYSELLAEAIRSQRSIERMRALEAFNTLDKGRKGFVTVGNLRAVLGTDNCTEHIESLIKAADTKKDGRISYKSFHAVLKAWNRVEL